MRLTMTRAAKWTRGTAIFAVLVVAGVAAVVSYSHMQHLAERSGEEWRSYLIPLSVDGMLVASTLAIVVRRRAEVPVGWVPWTGLGLGILASLAANVAAARPDAVARIIAAWPPLAFALAVEILVIVLRATRSMSDSPIHSDSASVSNPSPSVSLPVEGSGRGKDAARSGHPPGPGLAAPTKKPKGRKPAPPPDVEVEARALEVLAEKPDISRREFAEKVGLSEHHGRTLLDKLRETADVG